MIQYLYLGRVDYAEGLRLQDELVALRTAGRIPNVLLLLEHPPVLTLGRNARRTNILASDDLLAARGVTLHEINRGGDVTYHGPGQLIGYPIFDLRSLRNARASSPGRLGPVDFVRLMEEALIGLCGEFGVFAGRICGLTGVWCGLSPAAAGASPKSAEPQNCSKSLPSGAALGNTLDKESSLAAETNQNQASPEARKIAAIGIHVARGVTSHGFAFNVTTDLRDFSLINPCGITDRPVTSLELEIAKETRSAAAQENSNQIAGPSADSVILPSLESIAHRAARQFGLVFVEPVQFITSLAALRAYAHADSEPEGEEAFKLSE
jgi:lipoyl(octanoyl) transferase